MASTAGHSAEPGSWWAHTLGAPRVLLFSFQYNSIRKNPSRTRIMPVANRLPLFCAELAD